MRYRSNMAWHTARSEELYIDKEEMPVAWSSGHPFYYRKGRIRKSIIGRI